MSSRPQSLGYGSSNVICNRRFLFPEQDTEVHTINLGDVVLNQPEFLLRKSLYKYMKIQSIRLSFLASNYTNSNVTLYFQLAYNLQPDTTNLEEDDQSKIVGPFLNRNKTFIFVPPNVTVTNFQNVPYNFKEWLPSGIGVVNMPLTLIYKKAPSGTRSYPCDIQIKVLFRGGNVVTTETIGGIYKELKETEEKKYIEKQREIEEKHIEAIEEDLIEEEEEIKEKQYRNNKEEIGDKVEEIKKKLDEVLKGVPKDNKVRNHEE